jgi:hypothetical protein
MPDAITAPSQNRNLNARVATCVSRKFCFKKAISAADAVAILRGWGIDPSVL